VLTQIGNWLSGRRKSSAEADATASKAWASFAAKMTLHIDALERRIEHLEAGQKQRDAIIVALAHKRHLTNELRALLLEIAPGAAPIPPDA
jgi:ABC-type dipeptide/oligopeptide/nickel transport system ATPase subunit